jgi:hypothetical protein
MVNIVQNVQFVYNNSGQVKRVSELFDPEDESLKLIIVDRNQFPIMSSTHQTPQNVNDHILFLNNWHIQQNSKISVFPVTTI